MNIGLITIIKEEKKMVNNYIYNSIDYNTMFVNKDF